MNATNAGVTGSKSFPAAAKALDNNSVALSKAIASVYGAKAGQTFLNGQFMWRDHIKFFVDYTVATAKNNKAGQAKAVANLKKYTVKFGDFLAGATGLPKPAVQTTCSATCSSSRANSTTTRPATTPRRPATTTPPTTTCS